MAASQSFLSNPKFGYDFVVATTQKSINTTMKAFLAKLSEPVVRVCFIADQQGNPVEIDYDTLVKNAKGSDPFKVPANADPGSNTDLQNLMGARFMAGFQAQLGLPNGYLPTAIPDLVILGTDTAAVTFNMLCSQFLVTELIPGGGYNPPTWTSISQPDGHAWIFESKVDLRMSAVDQSAYGKLPPDVQAQIQNLGGNTFSVQQLLFDLSNAGLASQVPVIAGVKPGSKLYAILQQYFLDAYFTELQKGGQPLLGVAVTHNTFSPSTLTLTNLNFNVDPFLGDNGLPVINPTPAQQGLATLNYLCEADGHAPLPAVSFNWNWVDSNEASQYHGTIATNRTAFVRYFRNQLTAYVQSNCLAPWVRVSMDGLNVKYEWKLTRGQAPTVTAPPTGPTVLAFSYNGASEDQAGLNGDMGKLKLNSSFNLNVTFSGNTIVVSQHLVVYMYGRGLFGISSDGNVVDKSIVDTYTLAVTQQGGLTATLNSVPTDNSKDLSLGGFVNFWSGDLNSLSKTVEQYARNVTSPSFRDLPLSAVQNFVFPGGRTFAFKTVGFSSNQDLVSHITYADPS